jgi:small GTP-binding protein
VFDESYRATIGVDFAVKLMKYPSEEYPDIELRLWDIAGQDKYMNFTRIYYSGAHAAIIVYDINNSTNVDKWKSQVDEIVNKSDESFHIPCVLVGNKIDLINPNITTIDINGFKDVNPFDEDEIDLDGEVYESDETILLSKYISEIEEYKRQYKFDGCSLISVKNNVNIDDLFMNTVDLILSRQELIDSLRKKDDDIVTLDEKVIRNDNKSCCMLI